MLRFEIGLFEGTLYAAIAPLKKHSPTAPDTPFKRTNHKTTFAID
jgi:hypothetical protein